MNTPVILGANGFLGYNLTKKFVDLGHKPICIVRDLNNIRMLDSLDFDSVFLFDDLNDALRFSVKKKINITALFNCVVDYGRDNEISDSILKANILYPLNSLLIVKELYSKVIFFTFDSYFSKFPDKTKLKNYVMSKKKLNELLKTFKINSFIIKIEHLFGQFDSDSKFFSYLKSNLLSNNSISLTMCDQKLDFIYIEDLVVFLTFLFNSPKKPNNVIQLEVGTGESVKLSELILYFKKCINSKSLLLFGSVNQTENIIKESKANIEKSIFYGFYPKYDYKSGIKEMLRIEGIL